MKEKSIQSMQKETLAQADLFLYQVFNGFDLVSESILYRDNCWFPTCYVYTEECMGRKG